MKLINIKESLMNMDRDTYCKYDLTSMYESLSLNEEKKKELVKYIDAYDIDATNKFLGNEFASQGLMEYCEDDDFSDDELASIYGGDTRYPTADECGVEDCNELEESALGAVALTLGTAAATGFGQSLGDKVGSTLLGEELDTTTMSSEINKVLTDTMIEFGFPEDEIKDYSAVEIKPTESGDMLQVEVRAELSYDDITTLADRLDTLIQKYDHNAYFEPVVPGIIEAFVAIESSATAPDEDIVAYWDEKITSCNTLDELRDAYLEYKEQREFMTDSTVSAINPILDAKIDILTVENKNESLDEGFNDYDTFTQHAIEYYCDSYQAEYEAEKYCPENPDDWNIDDSRFIERAVEFYKDSDFYDPEDWGHDLAEGIFDSIKNAGKKAINSTKNAVMNTLNKQDAEKKQAAIDYGNKDKAAASARLKDKFNGEISISRAGESEERLAAMDRKVSGPKIASAPDYSKNKKTTTRTGADLDKAISDAGRKGEVYLADIGESLDEGIDDDISFFGDYDYYDDEDVTFIEDGVEYEWLDKRITSHDAKDMDGFFNTWYVASAKSLDNGETYFFVIDDTDFIDWGPCDTQEEAYEFVLAKDSDYDELDEAKKMTANKLKDKYGTDNVDIINAGTPEEERVELKEATLLDRVNAALAREEHSSLDEAKSIKEDAEKITIGNDVTIADEASEYLDGDDLSYVGSDGTVIEYDNRSSRCKVKFSDGHIVTLPCEYINESKSINEE